MNLLDYSENEPTAMEKTFHQNKYGCDYDQQRKLQQSIEALEQRHKAAMTTKLTKVAELFELDVLSEDEALKACKVIIGQHAKVRDKTGPENSVKVIK